MYYIKEYPFSLVVVMGVVYLSFFKPPMLDEALLFEGIDKVVHFCMYGGLSGMLWLEFLFNHRKGGLNVKRGLIGAVVCPIFFSGLMELGQEYLTVYRGGEWLDFLANTLGVFTATFIAWYVLRPFILKRN